MADLKAGDVVKPKLGGPEMLVEEVSPDSGTVPCVWFDKDDHKQGGYFSIATLEKVRETTIDDVGAGDVVKLKLRGPEMVVDELSTDGGRVGCVWFDKDDHRQGCYFSIATLKKVRETTVDNVRVGDVVKLKSPARGPKMLVEEVATDSGRVGCVYREKDGHQQMYYFAISSLEKVHVEG